MRRLLVMFALGACAPYAAEGPAWPKLASADKDAKDGGESLAPQESRSVAVAVEKSIVDTKPSVVTEIKPIVPAAMPEAAGTPAAAPPIPPEEGVIGEDIIIEIDD